MYQNALPCAQNTDVPGSLFALDVPSNSDVRCPVGPDAPQSQMPSLGPDALPEPDAMMNQMPFRARRSTRARRSSSARCP
ncbi:hypothetical protein DY000_02042377 [Brassica cretica]|uniref:Uncharacterized protein n=1 Tax=Brassica cretica TaxID=69181 RepID=A0ABQ7BQ47_BRACR|nr:hypothetical protein DY000_02042377 [Brassica cretica]